MRFGRTLVSFIGLPVLLLSGEFWLRSALAFNTGRIVFTSTRDGNSEIIELFVMDADGGNRENLTNHPAQDGYPDWSPDGTKIAFVSLRSGGSQIYAMDADGNNPVKLTDGPRSKSAPDWSPDGRKIAFTVHPDFREEWVHHIAVMDADGKNRERLEDFAAEPSWSPDGQQIAFISWRARDNKDRNHDIYVISADGQRLKRVTHDIANQQRPSFSPDGQRIAYMARHKGFIHIYVIDTDGTNRQRLTHNEENHWDPAWSPDGRAIAYYVWTGNASSTIHLMTADGQYLKQLSDVDGVSDAEPDISPLGLAVSPAWKTTTIWGRLKKRAPDLE